MTENFPNIDNEYIIPKETIDYFWKNGFVVLKNVLSKNEIKTYRNEIKRTAEERNKNNEKTFGGAFHQALNIRFDSKGVEKFCLSKGSIMGMKRVLSCHPIKLLGGGSSLDFVPDTNTIKKENSNG